MADSSARTLQSAGRWLVLYGFTQQCSAGGGGLRPREGGSVFRFRVRERDGEAATVDCGVSLTTNHQNVLVFEHVRFTAH